MRFFQNTPMAIATVDKSGRIARSNARFASAFEGMLKRSEGLGDERSILAVVAERDRPALEAAIRKALQAIERDGNVVAKPQMIRIEKL